MAVNATGMSLPFLSFPQQGVWSIVTYLQAYHWKIDHNRLHLPSVRTVSCVEIGAQNSAAGIFPWDSEKNHASTNGISMKRYLTKHLEDWFKQRLPCFGRYYGVNSEKKFDVLVTEFSVRFGSQMCSNKTERFVYTNNIFVKTEHLLSNWESPHWNIWRSWKVNYFIWLLCWFWWICCVLNATLNAKLAINTLTQMIDFLWFKSIFWKSEMTVLLRKG